ncbi:glycosyltransferase [Tatumella ptyseos]|uniref:glycosyltransferase n=1 Tax=Tatumella ptyseos TaxID=82987 RepID=UPI0026EB34EF|nr:glycosyltransferase [Tatumella ptyseos]WKX25350.1 glycosyltransferase [Tatumella ptyseos]
MFFGQELINHQLNVSSLEEDEEFNIAYGADDEFMFGAGVSIESVIINNKDKRIHFHIFTDDISEGNKRRLLLLCQNHRVAISIYSVNTDFIRTLPSNNSWNYTIYFRLIIADYFTHKLSKILYLDADVFCNRGLSDLMSLDLKGYTVAAVRDPSITHIINIDKVFSTRFTQVGYFNSGVMLINLDEWSKYDITKKSMDILTDDSVVNTLTYYDQDAINIATCETVLFIDDRYNYIIDLNYKYKCCDNLAKKKAALFHFVGLTKPWHAWSKFYDECEPFRLAKESSPWCNEPLIKPKTKYNYKYAAKHNKYNKNFIRSFYSYIKYKISDV